MRFFAKFFIIPAMLICVVDIVSSQVPINTGTQKVFYIGQNEGEYSKAIKEYPESLLTVSKDSMDLAYVNWMYLMKDIEVYSKKIKYDLNGIKLWLNVFWNKDGKIDVISYYPKPNSRNIEFEPLSNFFTGFINQYLPRLKYKSNFSHYGSARFPSFAEMYLDKK